MHTSTLVFLACIIFAVNTASEKDGKNINLKKIRITDKWSLSKFGGADNENATKSSPKWNYYVSREKIVMTDAMFICSSIHGGRLLSIFTREEDEIIRLRLQTEGLGAAMEYVATSAKWNDVYDNGAGRWEWSTTLTPLDYSRFQVNPPPIGVRGECIAVVGELSSYSWVVIPCGSEIHYICQF